MSNFRFIFIKGLREAPSNFPGGRRDRLPFYRDKEWDSFVRLPHDEPGRVGIDELEPVVVALLPEAQRRVVSRG